VAVVGEAHIVVRAITTGVAAEIAKALKDAEAMVKKEGYGLGQSFNDGFSRGMGKKKNLFGDLFDPKKAIAARKAWASLQRTGMTLQTGIGVLAGSIGALVTSLGALIGSAGGAAASLVSVGGAAIGAGIGMKLAGMALGGVTGPMKAVGTAAGGTKKTIKELREEMQQLRFDAEEAALSEKEAAMNLEKARNDLARVQDLPPNSMARREAELAYEQADLALRRAIDRNNDLQDEIKNGVKDTADASSGVDPYAGLTKSQRAFAKLLVDLKPKFDALKEAVAKGFLPALGNQIETLMSTNYPTLLRMFTGIGEALGDATDSVFGFINSSEGMSELETLFKNSEGVIRELGEAFGSVLDIILTLLNAAAPITQKFVEWISDSAEDFAKFLDAAAGDGSLQKFFEDASRVASDFGDIFGNIFNGFGDLITDSLKPGSGGDLLIQWLKGATEGFANMGEDSGFHKFMQDASNNAIKMFQALGGIFDVIMGMADDPAIGEFWTVIAEAEEPMRNLLENGAKAGPALADLVVQVTRIMESFGDSGQLEAFFGTLRDIAKSVADFFAQKQVKDFMAAVGPLIGTFLALGLALKVGAFGFRALLGTFNMFAAPFKYFFTTDVKTGMTQFQTLKQTMKGTFDNMKTAGKNAYTTVKDAAKYTFDQAKIGFKLLADNAKTAFSNAKSFATSMFDQTKIGFKLLAEQAKDAAKAVGGKLKAGFDAAKGAASKLGTAIANVTTALWKNTVQVAKNVAQWIAQKIALVASTIAQTAMRVATVIATGVQAAFNFVMALNPIYLIVAGVLALVAALIWFFTQTELGQEIWANFTRFLGEAWANIVQWFTDVWNGFITGFQTALGAIGDFFRNIWDGITGFFRGIINGYIGMVEGFVNFFIDGINNILRALNTIRVDPPDWFTDLTGLGEFGINIPLLGRIRLPRLAEGGVVSPSAGGTLAQIAEAGRPERVEPLDEDGLSKRDKVLINALGGGGAGVNITVNPSAGMDETALAALVSRRLAFELRKGAIA
jgi:hypothetical protein